ncbi:MAG: hypothetical protein NWQ55_12990 [Salibacteraceae bacterium]|nr:hypothetical protein [Salibacteraceae bacterium]MDP4687509.1 hypothetical protein [Salibacteraceae bacterium]MDP4763782.1 hypothetical protein [Salibacteraceae bacterium]MDP4843770.1 hypothetical protein [Salibacteraceae bacterium]MDP4934071.1 hypothetical protein [Salibacteraceae bacterium]
MNFLKSLYQKYGQYFIDIWQYLVFILVVIIGLAVMLWTKL